MNKSGGTAVNDLVTWLREQIADVSARAQAALERGTSIYDSGWLRDKGIDIANAVHIAGQHPRTVLAQCEAHTAILAVHNTPLVLHPDDPPSLWKYEERCCLGCGFDSREERVTPEINDCPTLRATGLAYQHRPGYREEWRP
jgi:hypothetical protein